MVGNCGYAVVSGLNLAVSTRFLLFIYFKKIILHFTVNYKYAQLTIHRSWLLKGRDNPTIGTPEHRHRWHHQRN